MYLVHLSSTYLSCTVLVLLIGLALGHLAFLGVILVHAVSGSFFLGRFVAAGDTKGDERDEEKDDEGNEAGLVVVLIKIELVELVEHPVKLFVRISAGGVSIVGDADGVCFGLHKRNIDAIVAVSVSVEGGRSFFRLGLGEQLEGVDVLLLDGKDRFEHVVLDKGVARGRRQRAGVGPPVVPVDGLEQGVHRILDTANIAFRPDLGGVFHHFLSRRRLKIGLDPVPESVRGIGKFLRSGGLGVKHDAQGRGGTLTGVRRETHEIVGVVHPVDLCSKLLTVDRMLGLVMDVELHNSEVDD